MHPVGPRSAGVYWIRRMFVALVAVAVVAGVVWFVVRRASGPEVDTASENVTTTTSQMTGVLAPDPVSTIASSGEGGVDSSAASTKNTGPSTKSTDTKATDAKAADTKAADTKATDTTRDVKASKTTTGAAAAKTTATKTAGKKATETKASKTTTGSTATKTAAKTAAAKTTPKTAATKTTPKTSTKATTTAPPKPSYDDQGRLLCPDSSIKVVATSGAKSYPVGSQPILGMAVTNTGPSACVRDLSGPLQVYTVYSKSGKRMWSTADCFPGEGKDVRQLAAGQTVNYNIKWSGTTSTPGCATPRQPVTAGSYTVVAALGKLSSKPHAFTITG